MHKVNQCQLLEPANCNIRTNVCLTLGFSAATLNWNCYSWLKGTYFWNNENNQHFNSRRIEATIVTQS